MIVQIGNWILNEEGIHHAGDPDYIIPVERLEESCPGDRSNMYDWLVHMPTKTWVSTEDVYTLNTIFIFAMEHFGKDFTSNSFVETLRVQRIEMQ